MTGSVDDRRGLDRVARPAPAAPCAPRDARPTPRRPRRRRPTPVAGHRAPPTRPPGPVPAQAGVELPRRRTRARSATGNTLAVMGPQLGYYYPEIVEQVHLTGPGIEAQGVGVPRRVDVHPHRAHAGLRVEPHVGEPRRPRRVRRAALQPRRHARRRARRPTTSTRACAGRSTMFDAGHAQRHAARVPDVGARPGDRHRDVERQADRADPPALDVRARRPQPRRAQGHDRRQGHDAERSSSTSPTSSASRSTGRTRRATTTAYFSSGLLPRRRRASTGACPTLGTGEYEWRGFLSERRAPARRRPGRTACC